VPPAPPVASAPSTEELKQQTARLQEQLSAMLFTEAPAAASTPPASPSELKLDTPVAEVANKILEIAHEESKTATGSVEKVEVAPEPKTQAKPVAPARTPSLSSLDAKAEEVEIPAWLRPLSPHSEPAVETSRVSEPAETSSTASESAATEESPSADSPARAEVAVFGGQLLSGDSKSVSAATSGSRNGLFIGLAAAVVLLAAGGFWYFRQNNLATTAPTAQASSAPVASEPVAATPSPAASTTPSRPAPSAAPPSSNSTNSAPERTSAPPPVTPTPVPVESRREAAPHNSAPAEEPAKKPALGEVRLAAPVVRRSRAGQASGEPLPTVDASAANSGADVLAGVARQKGPAVPVGGDVKPAQLLKSVPPLYPQMARSQHVTGNVMLDALINVDGNVAQVKVISGPPVLHQAALEAVKQWKYSPAQLNGNATASHLTVMVQFRTQ
jgi:protein TonB